VGKFVQNKGTIENKNKKYKKFQKMQKLGVKKSLNTLHRRNQA